MAWAIHPSRAVEFWRLQNRLRIVFWDVNSETGMSWEDPLYNPQPDFVSKYLLYVNGWSPECKTTL